MKITRVLLLCCILMFCASVRVQAVEIDPTCSSWVDVGCVRSQFGNIRKGGIKNYGEWSPDKGVILYSDDGDTTVFRSDGLFQVFLHFDEEAIDFYEKNSWAGIEIDIQFPELNNFSVPRIDPSSIGRPKGVRAARDTIIVPSLKETATRGIVVLNPSAMRVGWNTFTFSLKDNIVVDLGRDVKITANIQLVANIADESFTRILFLYNSPEWAIKQYAKWSHVVRQVGLAISLGDEIFQYFSMANAWQSTFFDFRISPDTNGEGFCWNSRDAETYAKRCNSSNFLEIVNSKMQPDITATLEFVEDVFKRVPYFKYWRYIKELVTWVFERYDDENDPMIDPEPIVVREGRDLDQRNRGRCDADVAKVRASNGERTKKHKKLTVESGEHIYAWLFVKNKGSANAKDSKISFYLDGGEKLQLNRREKDLIGTKKIGDLYVREEVWFAKGFKAPEVDEEETFTLYACVDTESDDKKPSNNCSGKDRRGRYKKEEFAQITVKPKWKDPNAAPDVDLVIDQIRLTHGLTSLTTNQNYGLEIAIINLDEDTPENDSRASYEYRKSGTNDPWQFIADDGSTSDQLAPGLIQWESISDEHGAKAPAQEGWYTFRACADYKGVIPETDESNNCKELDVYVSASPDDPEDPIDPEDPVIKRSITITSPEAGDSYRTDEGPISIKWTTENIPSYSDMILEYSLNGGEDWLTADKNIVNDESRQVDFCDLPTEDSDDVVIRITSKEYPGVFGISEEFEIDRAAGCEEL